MSQFTSANSFDKMKMQSPNIWEDVMCEKKTGDELREKLLEEFATLTEEEQKRIINILREIKG